MKFKISGRKIQYGDMEDYADKVNYNYERPKKDKSDDFVNQYVNTTINILSKTLCSHNLI